MPDTPPTPTVIVTDRKIAEEWYRCPAGDSCTCREPQNHAVVIERFAAEIAAAREAARPPLFVSGDFTLHSGLQSPWKIDCDALTNADWATLAAMAVPLLRPFKEVEGIPRGGIKFATALRPYAKPDASLLLLVDDVLTTGESMEQRRAGGDRVIGVVAFARGPWPSWVTPLFATAAAREAWGAEHLRKAVITDCCLGANPACAAGCLIASAAIKRAEAVAALVEAAERVRDCATHPAIRDLVAKGWELWSSNTSGAMNAFYDAATVQLRAALERVKGAQG